MSEESVTEEREPSAPGPCAPEPFAPAALEPSAPIVVIDYHKGNLSSVERGLVRAGYPNVLVTDDPDDIVRAAGLVLPGVGSFYDAVTYIRDSGQELAVKCAVSCGVPLLGICLGMQVLFSRGDEGVLAEALGARDDVVETSDGDGGSRLWVRGMGLFPGSCTRLESERLKVPHVGWDQLRVTAAGRACPLLADVPEGANVYFTHSYAVAEDADPAQVAARTHYARSFPCVVWGGDDGSGNPGPYPNVYGCQFHPEKSSGVGELIMGNFARIVRDAHPLSVRAREGAWSLLTTGSMGPVPGLASLGDMPQAAGLAPAPGDANPPQDPQNGATA